MNLAQILLRTLQSETRSIANKFILQFYVFFFFKILSACYFQSDKTFLVPKNVENKVSI